MAFDYEEHIHVEHSHEHCCMHLNCVHCILNIVTIAVHCKEFATAAVRNRAHDVFVMNMLHIMEFVVTSHNNLMLNFEIKIYFSSDLFGFEGENLEKIANRINGKCDSVLLKLLSII